MSRRYLARMLPVVLVAVALCAPSAWGAPRQAEGVAPATLLSQVWHSLTAIWADIGCIIDPNGGCTGGQIEAPAPSSDEGCILDPHGGCRPES